MALAHCRMLIRELLNKNPDLVTEEDNLLILDIKSAVFTSKNGKYANHTRHISRRVHFLKNGEK